MRRVVITGMGIVSPVGTGIEYAWKNILDGKSGVRKIDTFDASDYRQDCKKTERDMQ